jgi:hypothetical protein
MVCRALVRAALALLVMAAQVAVTATATGSVQRPDAAIYFCCCVGECSCTGDCCNHAPENGADDESFPTRIGPAGLALEAPRSCGVWSATLQRGQDQGKVIIDDRGVRSTIPLASTRLRQFQIFLLESVEGGLQPFSPRAPPSLPACI